jgi:uncharacterized protein involved in response to NO
MDLVRREPFRLFFPLALALGWAGMLPWFLFARGLSASWPGPYHALTMTEAFLAALAVGFLGTMVQRRAPGRPMSWIEIAALAAGLIAIPIALQLGRLAAAQVAFAAVLLGLAQFVVRRFRSRGAAGRAAPPSFVLVPIAMLAGLLGAAAIVAYQLDAASVAVLLVGRQLVQQGMMLALVLAIVPMVAPILATGAVPADPPPRRAAALRALWAGAGALLAASFAIEQWSSAPAGLAMRGTLCATAVAASGPWRSRRGGLHRALFSLATWLIPAGLLGAAFAEPMQRIPLLHLTFVGGFSLLTFAVSTHVTLLHTGRAALAERSPWPVAAVGALMLLAMLIRAGAERMPHLYFESLTAAAALWLLAALVWAGFLVPKLRDREAA